jgi:hypothetical protein
LMATTTVGGDTTPTEENASTAEESNDNGHRFWSVRAPGIEPPAPPFPVAEWARATREGIDLDTLTQEKRDALYAYFQEYQDYEEKLHDVIGLIDLAAAWDEDTKVEMLTSRRIRNEFHDDFGASGAGKTWVALADTVEVVEQGLDVIWVDQEMEQRRIKERLKVLGFTPEQVRNHFTYLQYPSFMDGSPKSRAIWSAILAECGCDLVVFDSLTPCFGLADVNENRGDEVSRWQQAYVAPVLRAGGSVLALDHTGWAEGGRPAGSRQKVARTRLEYGVKLHEGFGRDKLGEISLTVTKNSADAPVARIGEPVHYRIGGDGEGGFVLEPGASASTLAKASERTEKEQKVRAGVLEVLRERREIGSQRQLFDLVRMKVGKGGRRERLIEIAMEMGASDLHPEVGMEPKANGGYRFWFVDDDHRTDASE